MAAVTLYPEDLALIQDTLVALSSLESASPEAFEPIGEVQLCDPGTGRVLGHAEPEGEGLWVFRPAKRARA
jgi:hypothetical protein